MNSVPNSLLFYLLTLLQEYGYPILWVSVFIGALGIPLPNTLVLLAAGAFAALGNFNFAILLAVAVSAFVAGDNASYWIGRRWGSRLITWLEQRLIRPRTVARSQMYFRRLGGWAIFFSRFLISALGGEINLLAGAEIYPYRRFLLYDLSGETLGALLPLSLGYIFGASWVAVGDILGSFSLFLLTLLIVLFLSYQALRLLRGIRRAARLKRQQALALWPQRQSSEAILSTPGSVPTLPLVAGNQDETPGRPGH